MIRLFTPIVGLAAALTLAGCASQTEPASETQTLEETQFQGLLKDATGVLGTKAWQEEEANFAAILARDDLSTEQRAQTYINRAIQRGSVAPLCAVADYERALTLYPDHPATDAIHEEIAYQKSRSGDFVNPSEIEDCPL